VHKWQTLLLEEKDKICAHILEEELDRAKAQIKASIVMSEEKPSYKSEAIGKSIAIYGQYETPEQTLEYVNNTQVQDIKHIAKKYSIAK
jgi:predicted Zn-dependent peptidase